MIKQVIHEEKLNEFCLNFKKSLTNNLILILNGEMGSGKTTFVKNLFPEYKIISPSFLHAIDYPNLLHIDAYTTNANTFYNLNIEDVLEKKLIIIEWGELLKEHIFNFNCKIRNLNFKRINQELFLTEY